MERLQDDAQQPPALPSAVLFDMDGTLTEPMLDFPAIKRDMGIGDEPILEALAAMTPKRRADAQAILHRHEEQAARLSRLNPGCREVLAWLHGKSVPVALITRNSRSSVKTVLATHGLAIEVLISREDAPPKPDPLPLLRACEALNVSPDNAWMVGDGVFDVRAAHNANVRSVWLSHRRVRPFSDVPWHVVTDLWELIELLSASRHAVR